MTTLHVTLDGNDRWSGRIERPREDKSDGPLRTLAGARDRVRQLKQQAKLSGPVTVLFAEGVYEIEQPVVFGPQDSYPVTYAAAPGAKVIFDGGRAVINWEQKTLDGKPVWSARCPEVLAGRTYFSFFVNGQRRSRPTWPKLTGPGVPKWLWMKSVPGFEDKPMRFSDGTDTFVVHAEDFIARDNLGDVEVVVLHYWVEERMPVGTYDAATGLVRSPLRSRYALNDDFGKRFSRYYLDNVKEALTEPGEWYLDRPSATLYYMPRPGETPENTDCRLPRIDQIIRLKGDAENDRPVEFIRFEGLEFRCTEATRITTGTLPRHKMHGAQPMASGAQSATLYGGAIELVAARYCAIENCTLRALGWYAIDFGDGCLANRVVGNHITDIGAGGVKMAGAGAEGPRHARTGNNLVSDNVIDSIGRVFHAGCGVIVQDGFGNQIIHNHIRDAYYTGISVGWVWGYADSVSRDNRIAYNHIHQLGQGWLSDMGGIYTLSVQPGTTITHNLIHNVQAHGYGGWGIYPDEGTSHVVIEHNIVHDCKSNCFNQHYGRENLVRNNVFVEGGRAICSLGRREGWRSFNFERNVCVSDGHPIWVGGYGADLRPGEFFADHNVYFDRAGPVRFSRDERFEQTLTIEQWRESGYDRHTLVADPGKIDLEQGVYVVTPGSAADQVGIVSIDLRRAGPRAKADRDASAFSDRL